MHRHIYSCVYKIFESHIIKNMLYFIFVAIFFIYYKYFLEIIRVISHGLYDYSKKLVFVYIYLLLMILIDNYFLRVRTR